MNITHNVLWNITFPEKSLFKNDYPLNWESSAVTSRSFIYEAAEHNKKASNTDKIDILPCVNDKHYSSPDKIPLITSNIAYSPEVKWTGDYTND